MESKTYKLLIADDEYWTREKMRHIIPWGKYNVEFLEPAENGEMVLKHMAEEVPDILISDINMPILNGVELVEQIREKYPQVITFIVSGYDDFEYVKSTLKAGAINYLLKPINRADLIHAVSEAMNIINERRRKEAEEAHINAELMRAASMLEDHEYSRLIDKKNSIGTGDFSLNLSLESAGYGFVLLKIHHMNAAIDRFRQDINQLSYAVKVRLREEVKGDSIIFNNIIKSNEFIIISKSREDHSHYAAIKYMKALEEIFRAPVTIVVNNYSYSVESLHHAYTQSVSLLMTRKYNNRSEIVEQNGQSADEYGKVEALSEEIGNQLQVLMKSHNKEMIKEVVKRSLKADKKKTSTYLDIKQQIRQINSILLANVSNGQAAEDMMASESAIDEVEQRVEALDIDLLIRCEYEVIDSLMGELSPARNESMTDIVRQVKEEIDQSYFEDLSLASLADKYMAEPSYLSKSFKQHTGENLMMYITRQRISNALVYIEEGRLSLTEVSFLVGYADYTYFSRVFKKITGLSPREYKGRIKKRDE